MSFKIPQHLLPWLIMLTDLAIVILVAYFVFFR